MKTPKQGRRKRKQTAGLNVRWLPEVDREIRDGADLAESKVGPFVTKASLKEARRLRGVKERREAKP